MVSIVYSPKYLEHETGFHPEKKERLLACVELLKKKDFEWAKPVSVTPKDLECVHSKRLVEEIRERSLLGKSTLDNVFNRNTFDIALLACGGALKAARLSGKGFSFALVRPPGHHVGKNFFGGFCYFNNVAFAVRKIQAEKGYARAMVLDFDMHHGNGTQEIFYKDKNVFYLSFHQNPLYTFPGTGFKRDNNEHIRSVPIDIGTKDKTYLKIFKCAFKEAFESFRPDIIGISAGFDVFISDFIVGNKMLIQKHETFFEMAHAIKQVSEQVPCFGTLEGGYGLEDLSLNLFNFLNGFK